MKVNLNTEAAEASKPVAAQAAAPEKEVKKVDSENNKKVEAFLIQKGSKGAQASEIAIHLGLMDKNTDAKSQDFKAACKKVRMIARDVVDKHPKGNREVRDGRQKIYTIA